MKNSLLLLLLSLVLSSCAFNKQFLHPTKMPENLNTINLTTKTDSLKVMVETETYQPTFLRKNGDTLSLDYTIESFVFPSSSGNNLNGWLLKSKHQNPKRTLIHFHGNGGFLYTQYQNMIPLLDYGFQVFLFDYSGYGFSEGKATRKNIIEDGRSAIKYAVGMKAIKNTEKIVYGQSLGGNLVAIIAPEVEDQIDGLVLEGAFSNHKDMAADVAGFLGRILVNQKHNALKTIKDFHKPLLVIHSTEDEIVPYALGEKLYEAAHQPKKLLTIDECHICGTDYYAEEIAHKIKNALKND